MFNYKYLNSYAKCIVERKMPICHPKMFYNVNLQHCVLICKHQTDFNIANI